MESNHHVVQNISTSTSAPVIDFSYRSKSGNWQPSSLLFEKLKSISDTVGGLLDVINHNGSVAKHQGIALFKDRIDSRINEAFTSSHPHVVRMDENGDNDGTSPQWVDLMNADLSSLSPVGEGQYRYNTGPFAIMIRQEDFDVLCSKFLRKLLSPAEPEDLDTEKDARLKVRQVLAELLREFSQATMVIQESLMFLDSEPNVQDQANSARTSSSPPESDAFGRQTSSTSHPRETSCGRGREPSASSTFEWGDSNSCPADNLQILEVPPPDSKRQSARKPLSRTVERWSAIEKNDLRTFLRGKERLTWGQIAHGFRQNYGSRRKDASIRAQAARLGFSLIEGAERSKIVTLKTPYRPLSSSAQNQTSGLNTIEPQEHSVEGSLENQGNDESMPFYEPSESNNHVRITKRDVFEQLLN